MALLLFTWFFTSLMIYGYIVSYYNNPSFKSIWFIANLLWKLRKNNSNPIVARLLYGAAIIMTPILDLNDPYAQGLTFLDVKEWKKDSKEV